MRAILNLVTVDMLVVIGTQVLIADCRLLSSEYRRIKQRVVGRALFRHLILSMVLVEVGRQLIAQWD